jgi:hypothetical protein
MSHVFRIYKDGQETFQDWFSMATFPYNGTNRASIADPNGATAHKEITSIPSPFARIDLVKTAFEEVNRSGNPDGDTIFHKMVSHSLDVSEIFFNIGKLADKVEIIPWDVNACLAALARSDSEGHRTLADVLGKYLQADAQTYNFDKMQTIYLLHYKQGPDMLNIIGATSPATLFFSTANDLSYVSGAISFGTDHPFGSSLQPLYRRDPDLIRAWFVMKNEIPSFATLFPEVSDYLDLTFRHINRQDLKAELSNPQSISRQNLAPLNMTYGTQANTVEVLGYPLYTKQTDVSTISSDFEIAATREQQKKVLVLPVECGGRYASLHYITDLWGRDAQAPYADPQPLGERKLPFDGTPMDYVTISDLLEDNLVKVPHTLNDNDFYAGDMEIKEKKLSYLLPLKPLFFSFFSIEDLRQGSTSASAVGKPSIKMRTLSGGGVTVTLSVPIKGRGMTQAVEYTRIYHSDSFADLERNRGGMQTCDFDGAVMPIVKFKHAEEAIYKVACLYAPGDDVRLSFYHEGSALQDINCGTRYYEGAPMTKLSDVYTIEKNLFDMIHVTMGRSAGYIVPNMHPQQEFNALEFAVDLGTSNTHIEYRKAGETGSQPFEYGSSGAMVGTMFRQSMIEMDNVSYADDLIYENDSIERDLMPFMLSAESDFHFPTRTVLALGKQVSRTTVLPFTHANIPLTHDRRDGVNWNDYKFDIKWGSNAEAQQNMALYIDCLMLMMRNKVVAENGQLNKTTLKWFYPSSMPVKRLGWLRQAWDRAYSRYFGEGRTRQMTESYAPIQYYFKKYATATDLVNIDIGGGTTDVAYASNQKVLFTTSFRFAANNLFANAYADDPRNGIVDHYKEQIRRVIRENNISELDQNFENYQNQPANMASFLFSLHGNSLLYRINPDTVDFTQMLQKDEDFRIVFLLFYAAIIYHVAQIVKLKQLAIPRHVSFGGNGSKSLNIITADDDTLSKFTRLIFEGVMGQPADNKLDVLGLGDHSLSKESTCKGGLYGDQTEDLRDMNVMLKADAKRFINPEDTYAAITEEDKTEVVEAVKRFLDFFFELDRQFSFDDNFGVTPLAMNLAREVLYGKDLTTFLTKGIELSRGESDENGRIEETFFFYPLKGMMQELSEKINEKLESNGNA